MAHSQEDSPWLRRGLEEIRRKSFFDGFQLLQGAIQRAFQHDDHLMAKQIISKALIEFNIFDQRNLACELVKNTVKLLHRKQKIRAWTELIPFTLENLRTLSLEDCIRVFLNQLLSVKSFQDPDFIINMKDLIEESNYDTKTILDLYYLYSGFLCSKGDFIECFNAITQWSMLSKPISLIMRTYLTLAELNAYEIEGCGKYLKTDIQSIPKEDLNAPSGKKYFILAQNIFKAVENNDKKEFYLILEKNSDLINPSNDGLLKALCDGISSIFKNKSGSGILSSFFGS